LFLVDKLLVLLDQSQLFLYAQPFPLLEDKACVILAEEQLDLDLATLLAYNKEESLLFLVDKELVQPDQSQLFLYAQPFLKLETKECAILTEDQLDLDLATLLAYNKEELLLFLAQLVVVPLLTPVPPMKAPTPNLPLPTQ